MRFDTELAVNLNHLRFNISLLRERYLDNQKIIFMIKANAYGHGIAEIADYASKNCQLDHFGVASLGEAIYLREKLPKSDFKIWVFSEINIRDMSLATAYREQNILPVISDMNDLEFFLENFPKLPLILKFNTGMNRLGINIEDQQKVIDLIKKSGRDKIHHLMTHFSSSYFKLKENDRTHKQYSEFCQIKENFLQAGIKLEGTSVANSGAIEQEFGLNETHVRPGLMLYGPQSVAGSQWDAKIISALRTKIIQLREIKKGTPVGYGGHVSHADGTIAYLPLGYGDGFLTFYSGLKLEHKNHPAQVMGRVNMDLVQLFFEKPAPMLQVGDEIELWSETQSSVLSIADYAKTIPYQIFTSISSRVSRRYYS